MELQTFSEIISCINHWETIRTNSDAVLAALQTVKSFEYDLTVGVPQNFHVYPGVCPSTGKFYVYLIADVEDREQSDDKLFACIVQTKIQYTVGNGDIIPSEEALRRIENWNKHVLTWIPAQVATTDGVFKAFNMPSDYMIQGNQYRTFFALANDNTQPTGYRADLITTDYPPREIVTFHDFTRPVPPFGGGLSEQMFYLLQL